MTKCCWYLAICRKTYPSFPDLSLFVCRNMLGVRRCILKKNHPSVIKGINYKSIHHFNKTECFYVACNVGRAPWILRPCLQYKKKIGYAQKSLKSVPCHANLYYLLVHAFVFVGCVSHEPYLNNNPLTIWFYL